MWKPGSQRPGDWSQVTCTVKWELPPTSTGPRPRTGHMSGWRGFLFLFCPKGVRMTYMPNTPNPDLLLSPGLCSETRLEAGSRHGRPRPVTGEQPDQLSVPFWEGVCSKEKGRDMTKPLGCSFCASQDAG